MNASWPIRFLVSCALAAVAFWLIVTLGGCAHVPVTVVQPHGRCVGAAHSYRLTPDGHKWYLDCVNQT